MAGPLAGVRVLDLTRFLAGPYCTMLLADYGADVVKIESLEGREFRPAGSPRDSYFFLSSNRGKRSVTLDLRKPEARALLLRIPPRFDVLVENYRPDVMERFGLSAEKLTEQFPPLAYCGISGFGPDGPYRLRPGFDQIAQGMSGFMIFSFLLCAAPFGLSVSGTLPKKREERNTTREYDAVAAGYPWQSLQ